MAQDYNTEVHYPDIEITRFDSSVVKRYYTSAFSNTRTANRISDMIYDYQAYSPVYNNIQHSPDTTVINYKWIVGMENYSFFRPLQFGTLDGTACPNEHDTTRTRKIYQTEVAEFDDEPLTERYAGDFNVTFKLFDNSWKRGHLIREEIYEKDFRLTEVIKYSYNMIPIKTQLYNSNIAYGTGSQTVVNGFRSFATSGWAQLTDVVKYKNDDTVKAVSYKHNAVNGLMEEEITKDHLNTSKSKKIYIAYAFEDNTSLKSRHMLSQKLFTVTGDENSTFNKTIGNNLNIKALEGTDWSNTYGDTSRWYSSKNYKWKDLNGNGKYDGTSEAIYYQEFTSYDQYGNPLEIKDANGGYTSVKYGHNSSLPIAIHKNAKTSETAYEDFEDGTTRTWNYWTTGGSVGSTFHTGTKSWNFPSGGNYTITKKFNAADLNLTGKYIYSAWVKTNSTQPLIQWYILYNNGSSSAYPAIATAGGSDLWERLELVIELKKYSGIKEIYLYARNHNSTNAACDFDDLRFFPVGSDIVTYNYDPVTLQLKSKSDANNFPSYVNYDGLQRLTSIKNHKGDILQSFSYDLKGSLISSTNPNTITSLSYRTTSDYTNSKDFIDGLGRKIQNQVELGANETIVSHLTYDPMGRVIMLKLERYF